MRKNVKGNKGITIVALVITIIVLLILVGITVSTITGKNGILNNSIQAKENTRKSEIINSAKTDILKKQKLKRKYDLSEDELNNILSKYGTVTEGATNIFDGTLITEEEYQIPVKDIYEANDKYEVKEKTLVEAFDEGELKVGDYLDYNDYVKNTNGSNVTTMSTDETGYRSTQSFAFSNSTTWRILGKEGDHLKLISGNLIKNGDVEQYLHLVGAEGWYHTNDELVGKENNILNRMCRELYSSDLAQEVRSVNIDDINSTIGYTLQGNTVVDSGNNPVTGFDGTIGNEIKYDIGFFGNFSPYNYLIEKNPIKYAHLNKNNIGDIEKGTGYYYDIPQESNVINEMLFTEKKILHNSYWLASSCVYASGYCYFGPCHVYGSRVGSYLYLFGSTGLAYDFWSGVRPVVSLKSNITINDLHKVEGVSEEIWTNTAGCNDVTKEYFKDGHGKIKE